MGILRLVKHILIIVARVVSKYFSMAVSTWFLSSSTQTTADDNNLFRSNIEKKLPKPFSQIPGPFHIPIIGSQWLYYFWIGPYSLDKLHLANEDKYFRYGPIVKEHHLWNFPIIHLYDKKDIEELLKYPSKFPVRPGLEAQCIYRRSRPDKYLSVGLVNAQGLEWHHLRSKLLTQLTSPALVAHTVKQINLISNELVEKIRQDRNSENIVDRFEKIVYSCGLEVIFAILLDQRLGALDKNFVPPIAERLMFATQNLFEVSHEAMYGLPWWKYFPTNAYKKLIECEDTIYDVFADFVHQAMDSAEDFDAKTSVFNQILAAKDVDIRDKIVTIIDLIAAGIETTGNALLFLLYDIVSNPEAKRKVYEELDAVLLPGVELTPNLLPQLKYLRACISESFRLSPVAPNVARVLEKPFTFQGYHVPAETLVVCETWVASLQDSNYPDAKRFLPERWLCKKENKSPFLAIPFGIGRRMCPGKRVAEQEMLILTAKLLLSFDISFHKPLEKVYKFLMSPKGPVKVILSDRR